MENNTSNDPSSTESEQKQLHVEQCLYVVLEPLVLEPPHMMMFDPPMLDPHMMFDHQPYVSGCRDGGGTGFGGNDDDPIGDDDDDAPSGPKPEAVDANLTLLSVGGLKEHVDFLKQSVMYPLIYPNSMQQWGVDPPKGIMFHGPPGTGKTLLAKALVSELSKTMDRKVSFFYQKGEESCGKFFGESEENLRKLFRAAEARKPSIIFFDEIDGLCPDREKSSQTSQAYTSVVTALLGLIDSVKRGEVLIIGATNQLDAVDPAIRRPGRFDKDLLFYLPDEEGRKEIIKIHTSTWPCDKPIGNLLNDIARKTVGFTGADLEKLCRDTAIAAHIRCGDKEVNVLSSDWTTAYCGMKRSVSNVYGSTIHISQPTMAKIRPLVVNIAKEIIDKIIPLIPNKDAWVKNICGCNSLLVWEPDNDSAAYFHQTIMNEVLSDPSINKITTYILDTESIAKQVSTTRSTIVGATRKIINQMTISEKPSILYIPQIDLLHNSILAITKEKYDSSFIQKLGQIPAANVLLLATHTGNIENLSPSIKNLFLTIDQEIPVRKPNAAERKAFFASIFMDLSAKKPEVGTKNQGKTLEAKFEEQWDLAVDISKDVQVEFLFKLHDALQAKKVELTRPASGANNNKLLLKVSFEQILERYRQSIQSN